MNFLITAFLLLLTSITYSAPTPVGPIGFNGGYVLSKSNIDLNDNESNDMCNCVVESDGGLGKRSGGERYVSQAVSSQPITSLFRFYSSSGSSVSKTLLMTNGTKVFHSTGGFNPVWVKLDESLTKSNDWQWVSMTQRTGSGDIPIAIGVSPENRIKKFDLNSKTLSNLVDVDGSTNGIEVRGKYPLMSKNYFLVGNVSVSPTAQALAANTTNYNSRLYYSILLQPSSMTANRFIEYRTNDGEGITGLGNLFDKVHIFKNSTIGELSFTVLNLTTQGGDIALTEISSDFGLEAPKTLASRGGYYILGSKDGIRLWDGGRRARATSGEELTLISGDIKPLIEKLIRAGTYKDSIGKYYPKKDWYLFSYIDPDKFPKNVHNSFIVYDFKVGKWFPICGINASAIEVFSGQTDLGELTYGDSKDGYVFTGDIYNQTDDPRKEIVVDVMDSTITWVGSTHDFSSVVEGSASLKISINQSVTESSMTLVKILPLGEWNDKTRVTSGDYLFFKAKPFNLGGITNLRVDLEVNDVSNAFDTNFTSVTISSGAFSSGSGWNEFLIKFSSFPIRQDWIDLNVENVPFASTLNFYGLRFVLNGVDVSSVSIDDVRVVQATKNPVLMNWKSKLFNFQNLANKNFGELILTYEKTPESTLKVDFLGNNYRTETFERKFNKELIVVKDNNVLEKRKTSDFEVIGSTSKSTDEFFLLNGETNGEFLVLGDRKKHRLVKMKNEPFGTIVSTFGQLGSGATNFNIIHQIKLLDQSIYAVDLNNHRIKEHNFSNLNFIKSAGSLGLGATSYHQPTGLTVNTKQAHVADEGNFAIKQINISTFGVNKITYVDYNKIGDSSLAEDDEYLYLAYEKTSVESLNSIDIILEKRIKTSNELVLREVIKKQNSVESSTYNIRGDIALIGDYIFIAFNDNFQAQTRKYFIQKRSKYNFSIINEFETTDKIYSLISYAKSYLSYREVARKQIGVDGTYFQVRFYDDEIDNKIKLFNQTFLIDATPLSYSR